MPLFEKVEQQVDFPALEREMLHFWDENSIFDQLRQQNAGKPKWSFLDGPITANNPMGVHHAWGRTYKDVYNRYFAMTGRELRYQQGFDCQGLWVEVEVEKELGLQSKRDIENLVENDRHASIARFVEACKSRVDRFARVQTEQSIRLGYWMDWDRTDEDWAKKPDQRKSYFTMSDENNYSIWSFLKKCHHRQLIYRGYDVMPWCGRCGVGLSEMEVKDGYKVIEHRAVFVRFPLLDRPGESLLAWTTTPWTLSSNVAAAVNPKLTYLQIQLKDHIYYVAKGAFRFNRMESTGGADEEPQEASGKKKTREWIDGVPYLKSIEQMFKEKAGKDGFAILAEIPGAQMVGWRYRGPFDHVQAQQHPAGFPLEVSQIVQQNGWADPVSSQQVHQVISWDDVGETEGTGIVHIAPGCGREDFELGKKYRLPPIAPLDDTGTFVDGFEHLSGRAAHDSSTADVVFDFLKEQELLFAVERYVHRYPHCWRCKTELLFRLVDEWFISMGPRETETGFRGEIMKVVDQVTFLPESINGRARERDWLRNMGDWMISKKRYWGLALPIWVDDEDPTQFEVIGSREELQERAVAGWDEFAEHSPHRPYVDQIKIRNPKTGNTMSRVPDVGNPWLDAGIVAFSTMKYHSDRDYWEQWYPADFITESFPGQFRNWFYALLAMSTMMSDGKPPFKTLLGFATARDQFGEEMHKTAGNSIEFIGAANEGYKIDYKLKAKEQPKLPEGGIEFELVEKPTKEGHVRVMRTLHPPIGADVCRWMYCRHNPAQNLNFGPKPSNEVRARFIIKLWNCYGFFVNYARLDQFDPDLNTVELAEREDIDRWIVSELQHLINTAHTAFTKYDVMTFCLEAERFVDEKLSNWYIRRNRDRLQSSVHNNNQLQSKWAAHSTLYEVLQTLAKLFAPIVPFLSEAIYQNTRRNTDPQSVHLCPYPVSETNRIDQELSEEMNALLTLVNLGSSARNLAKIRVRQVLAELVVQSSQPAVVRAAHRFSTQLLDELNIKALKSVEANSSPLLQTITKLNKKTAASKLGANLAKAEQELASSVSASELVAQLAKGTCTLAGVELDANDIQIDYLSPEGWVGVADRHTQLMISTIITPELKREGLSREIIRKIQDFRKKIGLEMEDRIELFLQTDSEVLQTTIDTLGETIGSETLTIRWAAQSLENQVTETIDSDKILISICKATAD
ncbi:MAG: isoleucine--tRNA ligase [Zavarzinella sp.]